MKKKITVEVLFLLSFDRNINSISWKNMLHGSGQTLTYLLWNNALLYYTMYLYARDVERAPYALLASVK